MIERQQVLALDVARVPGHLAQPPGHLCQRRRCEAGTGQQDRERVDIVAGGSAPHQRGLHGRRAPTHERIVHGLARLGQAVDEELGELRLEAGPITDLVQVVRPALPGGPELVAQVRNPRLVHLLRRGAERREAPYGVQEAVRRGHKAGGVGGRCGRGHVVKTRERPEGQGTGTGAYWTPPTDGWRNEASEG